MPRMPQRWARSRNRHQIQHDRRRQDAVTAQEIDLDLHRITEPSVDVDVVPAFFIVASRRIVVDADLVGEILVKVRIKLRLKDLIQDGQLAFFLRLERFRIVENFAVAIAEDVR